MELEFEPHPENGYDLGSLKEGMIFQDRVMLNWKGEREKARAEILLGYKKLPLNWVWNEKSDFI